MPHLEHSNIVSLNFSFAQYEIDGYRVMSTKFELKSPYRNMQDCAYVRFVTPTEIYVNGNEPFNVSLKLITETGSPPNNPLLMAAGLSLYTYDDALKMAPKIARLDTCLITTSDSNGIATFLNCNVL